MQLIHLYLLDFYEVTIFNLKSFDLVAAFQFQRISNTYRIPMKSQRQLHSNKTVVKVRIIEH